MNIYKICLILILNKFQLLIFYQKSSDKELVFMEE